MLPNAATYNRGTKDTADVISQEKPLEISNKIWMYDPNENKGLAWLLRNEGKESAARRTFGHLEDTPFPNWVEYRGNSTDGANADEAAQRTDEMYVKSDQGPRLTTGSRIFFPRTDQIVRLTEDMNSSTAYMTGTFTRNFGRGTAADFLKFGDKGLLLPPVFEEGFTMGKGLANTLYYKSFQMGEVSYPIQVTNVEQAEYSRAGNPFQRALAKTLKQAKDQMEAEMFFGGQSLDTTTYAHPMGSSDGLDNYISTHVYSANTLSRMDFFDILTEWQMNNKTNGAIFCSLLFKSMVTQWAMNATEINIPIEGQQGEGQIGLTIDRVRWIVGTYDLIDIDLFNQEETLLGKVFFVPAGHTSYRPLVGNGENLDIAYHPVARDEVHAKEGEVYGVYGMEYFEEEKFAKISDIEF